MNRVIGLAVLWWAACAGAALAQAAPGQPDPCATTACRAAIKDVVIRVDDARYQTIPVARSPYVLDPTTLLIFPGETVAIQLTVEGDKIVGARFLERLAPTMPAQLRVSEKVAANPDDASLRKAELSDLPANVLLLSYGQQNGVQGMMLTVQHNLPKTLKVDAIIAFLGSEGYSQKATSTCPMRSKIMLMEHWPNTAGPIILTKLRALADDADMACR